MYIYTVKMLEKGTVLDRTEVNVGRIKAVGKKTSTRVYAVLDEAGKVAKDSKGNYEIFQRKDTAQQVADYRNGIMRRWQV